MKTPQAPTYKLQFQVEVLNTPNPFQTNLYAKDEINNTFANAIIYKSCSNGNFLIAISKLK